MPKKPTEQQVQQFQQFLSDANFNFAEVGGGLGMYEQWQSIDKGRNLLAEAVGDAVSTGAIREVAMQQVEQNWMRVQALLNSPEAALAFADKNTQYGDAQRVQNKVAEFSSEFGFDALMVAVKPALEAKLKQR